MQSFFAGASTRRILLVYVVIAAVWIIASNIIFNRLSANDTFLLIDDLAFAIVIGAGLVILLRREHTDKLAAQSSIEVSEERFRAIFERSATGILIVNGDGIVYELNPAVQTILGYSAEQIKSGGSLGAYYHPEDRTTNLHLWDELRSGKRSSYQVDRRMFRADGTMLWARLTVSLLKVPVGSPPLLLLLMDDVTERMESIKLLEQRVAERTRELETLLSASTSLASTLDLQTLFSTILRHLHTIVAYDEAALIIYSGRELEISAHVPADGEKSLVGLRLPAANRESLERTKAAKRAITGTITDNVPPLWAKMFPARSESLKRWRSWLLLPLIVQDEIVGMVVAISFQPDFFTEQHCNLVTALGNLAAVAIENVRLVQQVEKNATDTERQRLARDLHDAVTQTLFSANLIAEVLPQVWENDPQEGERRLQDLRRMTRGALAEMRALLMELRPITLVETPLADLLRQAVEAGLGRSKVNLQFTVEGRALYPAEVQTTFYRIAQESINNIIKHSKAKQGWVHLLDSASSLELIIRDDGRGFDKDGVPSDHFGVQIMHERARTLDAHLRIESEPGNGTTVRLMWQKSVKWLGEGS